MSKMTETALVVPMEFYETNFFIISTNPEYTTKVAVLMYLASKSIERPSNIAHKGH